MVGGGGAIKDRGYSGQGGVICGHRVFSINKLIFSQIFIACHNCEEKRYINITSFISKKPYVFLRKIKITVQNYPPFFQVPLKSELTELFFLTYYH